MLRSALPFFVALLCAAALGASPDGEASMGHLHFNASDLAAQRRFWTTLGAAPRKPLGRNDAYSVENAVILVRKQAPAGPMAGSTVAHVGFRVSDLAATLDRCRTAGYKILTAAEAIAKSHKANVLGPDGINAELVEDGALAAPIAMHHIHFYASPLEDVRAWYVRTFDAVAGKREIFEAADLPGVNLSFSAPSSPPAPTKGRALDHIGFEVMHLEAFCRKLEAQGVKFDQPYTPRPELGLALAFLIDPWGTYIELTEGLKP